MKGGRSVPSSSAAAVTVPPRPVTPILPTPVRTPPPTLSPAILVKFASWARPGAVNASSVHNGHFVITGGATGGVEPPLRALEASREILLRRRFHMIK